MDEVTWDDLVRTMKQIRDGSPRERVVVLSWTQFNQLSAGVLLAAYRDVKYVADLIIDIHRTNAIKMVTQVKRRKGMARIAWKTRTALRLAEYYIEQLEARNKHLEYEVVRIENELDDIDGEVDNGNISNAPELLGEGLQERPVQGPGESQPLPST